MDFVHALMKVELGKLEEVLKEIRGKKGVLEASVVTGFYDIMTRIERENLSHALSTVVKEIIKMEGIGSTETLVVVKI